MDPLSAAVVAGAIRIGGPVSSFDWTAVLVPIATAAIGIAGAIGGQWVAATHDRNTRRDEREAAATERNESRRVEDRPRAIDAVVAFSTPVDELLNYAAAFPDLGKWTRRGSPALEAPAQAADVLVARIVAAQARVVLLTPAEVAMEADRVTNAATALGRALHGYRPLPGGGVAAVLTDGRVVMPPLPLDSALKSLEAARDAFPGRARGWAGTDPR